MHIKKIIIEGFKSYKEEVSTDPFSPKVNCVVGANGSGKTNFFHAIRFVLSDLFQNLRSEDRQALLHEGAGHQVMSAFVEIVFDNSDNRIPVDKEEVRLRRTIGVKKDEYFLDGKHVTKTEVMNLLESAGFSRSNPYYVVQQGKIASLTLMKDSERLDLLKEIGGTRVYEERRRESLKIMQETGNKRKQIDQVVHFLEERLRELDEEKEELKKYQQLDKKIRSLEYIILEKEMDDAAQKLREIEDARNTVSEKSANMHNKILKNHDRVKELDKDFKTFSKAIQGLNKDKEVIEKRRTEALKIRTQLELDLKDIEERISGDIRAKDDAARQLKGLRKEIQDSRNELNTIRPLHNEKVAEEEGFIKGIMECEKQLSILYQKQGRATQFASKAARDKWLQREIDDLQRPLSSHLGQEKKIQEEIQQLKDEENKMDFYIEEQRAESKRLELAISKIQEEFNRLRIQRDELQDKRKSLWKTEGELSAEIDKLRSDLVKAKKSLDHATPGDTRRGLNSVDRYVNDHNIEGVFGSLLELIECDEKFFTAVEVTAGNSLFHVVVATDDISSRIIRYLTSEKGGRVTFIPLNRVIVQRVNYPQSSDVVPLLKKLKFRSDCSAAFQQVFSRTVICRDLDVATNVARANGLDCITLEGDQVSKKGGMTGGFYDSRRSKLKFMNIIKQSKSSILKKTDEQDKISRQLQDLDREINDLVSRQQRIDAERGHMKSELEQLKLDIANAVKQKQSISRSLEKKGKLLGNALTQIDQIRAGIAMKRAEMGTDLVDQLTPKEKDLLSRLNPEITELKEKLLACTTSRVEIETRKEELETNLSTNLVRRQQELEAIILSADSGTLPMEAELKRQELEDSNETVHELMKQLNQALHSIDEFSKKIKNNRNEKDRIKATEEEYERTLQDEAKDLEQLLNKRNLLMSKQDDCKKKIRDLGSLPSDAFERYKKKNIKELVKMLHKCNEELKQFSHVNKKALDQYMNFTEQREQLQNRRAELDAGDQKIRELISVLDQRKDESIERTFKGVARNFREVFSELVQGGHGFLVMMKKKEGEPLDDENDEDGPPNTDPEGRVEKYIGVKVKVSFTGQGETQSMKQLSGGQKTVVALTLIFAIQRCDPAPFYLFDEIDAALDPQYRTSVGNMIRRLADMANTQFITTTFRPELVKVADKIYGVTHKNRVSHVNVVSKEEALDFIEQDQNHSA
ncbi:structural maintenance of chromosomes protein 3 [Dendrobium catenatum]|uniref:structural maintenance of chromosomes protein 3 n=1 Tax=Dendrobium catenatum TaxID=906689 RepID=UPI0009F62A9E|nr:structural maintenance of chromosomes protein 3 [Dendrobium catenatum]XP_028552903.1 structural maintenance of chromosomes protein 3 [Dendrobium catenatum]